MRATMIVGEPAVGKSTIVKAFLEDGAFRYRKDGGLPRHEDPLSSTVVLGRYDEEHQFPGTDRLHMGIKPVAMEHCHAYGHQGWHVVFEGARLGNGKTIDDLHAMGFHVRLGVVVTEHSELMARRALERDQSEQFLRARGTAVHNMVKRYASITTLLRNDERGHVPKNVAWIKAV